MFSVTPLHPIKKTLYAIYGFMQSVGQTYRSLPFFILVLTKPIKRMVQIRILDLLTEKGELLNSSFQFYLNLNETDIVILFNDVSELLMRWFIN